MEDAEGQEPDGTVAGRLFRLDESTRSFRKSGFNRRIIGVEKAEAGHRPAGNGVLEGLGRVFPMDETGVAQEVDMDERQQEEQAEASAELFPLPLGHGILYFAIREAARQLGVLEVCACRGRKESLRDVRNFTFRRESSP
jgi:hypothetical protein